MFLDRSTILMALLYIYHTSSSLPMWMGIIVFDGGFLCMCVCVCMYVFVCLCVCVGVCVCMYVCVFVLGMHMSARLSLYLLGDGLLV